MAQRKRKHSDPEQVARRILNYFKKENYRDWDSIYQKLEYLPAYVQECVIPVLEKYIETGFMPKQMYQFVQNDFFIDIKSNDVYLFDVRHGEYKKIHQYTDIGLKTQLGKLLNKRHLKQIDKSRIEYIVWELKQKMSEKEILEKYGTTAKRRRVLKQALRQLEK